MAARSLGPGAGASSRTVHEPLQLFWVIHRSQRRQRLTCHCQDQRTAYCQVTATARLLLSPLPFCG